MYIYIYIFWLQEIFIYIYYLKNTCKAVTVRLHHLVTLVTAPFFRPHNISYSTHQNFQQTQKKN